MLTLSIYRITGVMSEGRLQKLSMSTRPGFADAFSQFIEDNCSQPITNLVTTTPTKVNTKTPRRPTNAKSSSPRAEATKTHDATVGQTVMLSIEKVIPEDVVSSQAKQTAKRKSPTKSSATSRTPAKKKPEKTLTLNPNNIVVNPTVIPAANVITTKSEHFVQINSAQPQVKIVPIVMVSKQPTKTMYGHGNAQTATVMMPTAGQTATKRLIINPNQSTMTTATMTTVLARPQIAVDAPIRTIAAGDVRIIKATKPNAKALLPNNIKSNERMQKCISLPISIPHSLCKPSQIVKGTILPQKKTNSTGVYQTKRPTAVTANRIETNEAGTAGKATICYIQGAKGNSCIKTK